MDQFSIRRVGVGGSFAGTALFPQGPYGVELLFIDVKSPVMGIMKTSGLDQWVEAENFFSSYDLARKEIYARLPFDITYAI